MTRRALDPSDVRARLTQVDGWAFEDGALRRVFEFGDFVAAFGWMASVALVAERMDHHPDWTNVYGTVKVALSTHDAGGVTDNDFELAQAMDRLATGRTR